jgi:hypothetical protein
VLLLADLGAAPAIPPSSVSSTSYPPLLPNVSPRRVVGRRCSQATSLSASRNSAHHSPLWRRSSARSRPQLKAIHSSEEHQDERHSYVTHEEKQSEASKLQEQTTTRAGEAKKPTTRTRYWIDNSLISYSQCPNTLLKLPPHSCSSVLLQEQERKPTKGERQ